jgi:UTP--glucose-1-phosphate uridylyltransferase
VRTAVFPVAGLGTRFLPATKASPKEMLPVVDKPLIQYAVEEAYAAGVRHMVFVTGRSKRAIEDHFDTAYELESELQAAGKQALLDVVRAVAPTTWTAATCASRARWAWAMPCCARRTSWASSPLPCCWPTT